MGGAQPGKGEGGAGATILVIEDEASIIQLVRLYLEEAGYTVLAAQSGVAGLEAHAKARPDLVILDLMLPGLDGLEVCKRIQRERPVPVLMLTARDTETDLVVGLAVGADDYMTKPFSMREVVARVNALLRRAEKPPLTDTLRVADVELDPSSRRVRRDGEQVHLTPTEFDLFQYLATRPGRVATRGELLEQVWGYEIPSGARTVDSHIRSLRRKLGSELIRTVHGVGYAVEESAV
jgi:DNA-binding response OmpR family regulator